jgi:hypothetical protein
MKTMLRYIITLNLQNLSFQVRRISDEGKEEKIIAHQYCIQLLNDCTRIENVRKK